MDIHEPTITINGQTLTMAQAMSLRCCLEFFLSAMKDIGIGDDTHGREMSRVYIAGCREIRAMIYAAAME